MNAPPPPSPVPPGFLAAGILLLAGAAGLWLVPLAGIFLLTGGVGLLVVTAWRGYQHSAGLTRRLAESEAGHRRQAEQLAEAWARYQQVMEHAADALFFINPLDGSLIDVNRRTEEMLGYDGEEMRRLNLDSLFTNRHRRRFRKLVRRILEHGSGEENHLQFRRSDGTLFFGNITARLAWLGKQQVVHGSIRDVTPNVQMTTELRRHHQHLSLLNEITLHLAAGHGLSAILGTILEQVVNSLAVAGGGVFLLRQGNSEMELAFHQGIPDTVIAELGALRPGEGLAGHVAATGRPRLSFDLVNDQRCACGSVIDDGWRAFLGVPLLADESCLGVLFIFTRGPRDLARNDLHLLQAIGRQIGPLVRKAELFDELQWQHRLNQASLRELERSRTALRENLEQLEQQNRMLQSLEQMKNTFLSLASHELRTPLTFIWSGAELLETTMAGHLDANGRCALEAILQGSRRLRDMIDDLLEAARLEANTVYLAREEFDPRELLEELAAAFRPACDVRRLTFTLGEMPVPVQARGDMHHLRRALERLLENAVKFTPEGGWIRLETIVRSDAEVAGLAERLCRFSTSFFSTLRASRYLEIRICDNGLGLAPGEEQQVFSRFYVGRDIASHSSSRERFGGKGIGLGLALARGLIAAHDGLLWVESAGRDQGSNFCLLLPLPEGDCAHAIS